MPRQPLYPHVSKISREESIHKILTNLMQAGVLLPEETARYRNVLEGYDNATLLKVLAKSVELMEATGTSRKPLYPHVPKTRKANKFGVVPPELERYAEELLPTAKRLQQEAEALQLKVDRILIKEINKRMTDAVDALSDVGVELGRISRGAYW